MNDAGRSAGRYETMLTIIISTSELMTHPFFVNTCGGRLAALAPRTGLKPDFTLPVTGWSAAKDEAPR